MRVRRRRSPRSRPPRPSRTRRAGPRNSPITGGTRRGRPTHSPPPCARGNATARYRQAAVLLDQRTRNRATAALATAERITAELGATPLHGDITTLARRARLDLRPVPAPVHVADPLGLTPREREVIALLDAGQSNAQIAKTLYISEKTASVHVSNIIRKLGVTSRLQAANAARHGEGHATGFSHRPER
jgi:DNA-binding CsgD family transcriptional regulator